MISQPSPPDATTSGKLAALIARKIFELGDEEGSPCRRLQFKGGTYPDAETNQGGVAEAPLGEFVERLLSSPTTDSGDGDGKQKDPICQKCGEYEHECTCAPCPKCAETEETITNLRQLLKDSCDDETAIQKLVAPILGEKVAYGDNYGVPTSVDLVELLAARITALEADKRRLEAKVQELQDFPKGAIAAAMEKHGGEEEFG